jgi:hypothetical protein
MFEGHATYGHHAETGRHKSKILAGRMKEHARNCAKCTQERRLEDEHFYGVYAR